MAARFKFWVLNFLYIFFLLYSFFIPLCFCQSNVPQNIETFYPKPRPEPSPSLPPPPPSPSTPSQPSKSPPKETIVKAVVATAASCLVISGLLFFLLQKYRRRGRREKENNSLPAAVTGNSTVPPNDFTRFNGNIKGLIVDEDGLDVLYWRKLQGSGMQKIFSKKNFSFRENEEREKHMVSKSKSIKIKESKIPVQEKPLLRGKSSASHKPIWAEEEEHASQIEELDFQSSKPAAPPSPPPPPPSTPKRENPPPPPPPLPPNKRPSPPPFPPKTSGLTASTRKPLPPSPPTKVISNASKADGTPPVDGDGESHGSSNQMKLKPLHWDKLNLNVDHSMVWDKVKKGSFRVDGVLMESLFGYVAHGKSIPGSSNSTSSDKKSRPTSQIFILDTRKSQNTAIVVRSLGVSRDEIFDSLTDGSRLSAEQVEKLTKIAPTKEEQSKILAFDGDPARLADAESFLYHLLKAIPSAFSGFKAMLFKSTYDSEVLLFKESLQAIELACKELRARGVFVKLLEAILKAGNRLNAGTSRGDAQAFNLSSLNKLSDVKSIDGKTTLLRFVVQEVVRAEGKRCVLNRDRSLVRNNSNKLNPGYFNISDESEQEHLMLGLPIVGGLSTEFSNVKKVATLNYDVFSKTCMALETQAGEIRQLVADSDFNRKTLGFVAEMKGFLDAADEEISLLKEEQTRVMDLVKETTDYYQTQALKAKGAQLPLHMFVIVRDFLEMVDQACVDIAKNMQRGKAPIASAGSSSEGPFTTVRLRFPKLPANFLSDEQTSSSSDAENGF